MRLPTSVTGARTGASIHAHVFLIVALGAALIGARPGVARAQHAHPPAAKRDSARADTSMKMTMAPGHDMSAMMEGPLGLSHVRMGSGTSWLPDSSPMHANHKMWGDWTVMLHGAAFGQYDYQGSDRGDKQLGIVDWEMLMAMRKVGTGLLHLHGMFSLEPATIGSKGYPLLLQTGESYNGRPLHDRQHPHDAFMEVAALFQQSVTRSLAVEAYAGLAGEPALGPVAFMHRPSAQNDPLAPLGHHWQDATHVSFGVTTLGLYSRLWKLEGSWFNGREPDENRWNFDLRGFDSYSGRLTVNPSGRVSVAGWYGYLASPEALHPDEQVHRYGTSLMYAGRGLRGGDWASTLMWSANERAGGAENSVLAESNLSIGEKNSVFGRAEYVRKSAEDLVLAPIVPADAQFDIRSLVGGYMREIGAVRGGTIGVGGRVSVNFIPSTLRPYYGTRTPTGIDVYVRIRPKRMQMNESSAGMNMPGKTPMPGMPNDRRPSAPTRPAMPMPGMNMNAPAHAMPMRTDSCRARSDSMAGMAGMPGMASPKAQPSAKPTATPKVSAKAKGKVSAKAKATSKAKVKKSSKAKAKAKKPATHAMPGMPNMPGMKMDSTAKRP